MAGATTTLDVEAQRSRKSNWKKYCSVSCPTWIQKVGSYWFSTTASNTTRASRKRIEDYPQGYPRFAALIGNDVGFALSRRFSVARARLLLKKQDKVSHLEQQLEELDQDESRPLFLGSIRKDRNPRREIVLQELDAALADYDALLERNARISHLPAAAERHTASLSNWIEFTGSICRNETGFLQEPDLCTIAKSGDDGLSTTEQFVERSFVWFLSCSGRSPPSTVSKDSRIFIFKGTTLRVITRLLITWIIVAMLLVPVVVIRAIRSTALQISCILVASGLFILVLSTVVNARTADIFIAGPTYAALLVVFIATKCNSA